MCDKRSVLAVPDKFRGSASAREVARAIAAGARTCGWNAVEMPMADGGEGTLEAFGGANQISTVTGPLGQPIQAAWQLNPAGTAVIEMARASGLQLAGGPEENNPLDATTAGTGELIAAAIVAGAKRIIVGVGGSAATDGGAGAMAALEQFGRFGDTGVELLIGCDVMSTFLDAGRIFGPQKGADSDQVDLLSRRLIKLCHNYRERHGVDVSAIPGSGAAGGLAGGLAALGARLVPGFTLISTELGFDQALRTADIVITGEGRLDPTSFNGKVVGGVVGAAAQTGVPALAVVGDAEPGVLDRVPTRVLSTQFGSSRSWADPLGCVELVVTEYLARLT